MIRRQRLKRAVPRHERRGGEQTFKTPAVNAAIAFEFPVFRMALDPDVAEFRMKWTPAKFSVDPDADADTGADGDKGSAIDVLRRAGRHFRKQRSIDVRIENDRYAECLRHRRP